MIQPRRFRIHETSRLWSLVPGPGNADAWRSFPILRRTARKVAIQTPQGERWVDRLPLELRGYAQSHGRTYYVSRFAAPAVDEEDVAA